MANPRWAEDPGVNIQTLERHLRDAPFRFQFFQAVRLMQRVWNQKKAVGHIERPLEEVVRFTVRNRLEFPASEIFTIDWPPDWPLKGQPLMCVNFMGLTGPMGVLPIPYSELLIERTIRDRDASLESFLNMFNHRMISLFYRAWEKYRFYIPLERGVKNDRFSAYLSALIGTMPEGLHDRLMEKRPAAVSVLPLPEEREGELDLEVLPQNIQERRGVPDQALYFYSGLLSLKPRSASAVGSLLADYFDVPVEIEQFVGTWYRLDASNQCRMRESGDVSDRLGMGSVMGDEILDHQSRARICLGPLARSRYKEFLPDGNAYAELRSLLQFLFGEEIGFDVRLILKRDEVPACDFAGADPLPLGWLTWMKSEAKGPFGRDPGDTILALN